MTTESKQRAANIKARREALGISFEGFYDTLNLNQRHGELVENGQYGKLTSENRDKAEKFLTHLEQKAKADAHIPAGTSKEFRILPNNGIAFTEEELVAFPSPEPTPGYSANRTAIANARASRIKARRTALGITYQGFYDQMTLTREEINLVEDGYNSRHASNCMDKVELFLDHLEMKRRRSNEAVAGTRQATPEQLKRCADTLCQELLRQDENIVTIPVAEFHEMVYVATGCRHFSEAAMVDVFAQNEFATVSFLISFGSNVVVICKDALFAPVP